MPTPQSRDRLERLIQATPDLVGELHLERVLQRVADLARDLLGAEYSAVGLLNPDHRTLQSFTTSGLTEEQKARIGKLPVGHGILGLVIHEGRVVRLPDLAAHPASVGFPPHHPPMKSFLGVPIVGRQGVLGDLYLTEKIGPDEFTDEDVHLALLMAAVIASAVENARFHEQRTRLLEEIQQLHRSRERFFAMVNHELRNSLAAVFGWAEIMVRKKDPKSVPRGALEILEAAEQAVSLVSDLLDLNRLDEDRLKPVIRDVDCLQVVQSAIQRMTPSAREKNVTLLPPDVPGPELCQTDSHRAEQIFVNLFSNAIRFTPPNSTVRVEVHRDDGLVIFSVLDQGPGVAPEAVEQIFDIYYTTGTLTEGTHGVGLALSRRLARLMGGDLAAVPQAGGGVFLFSLPAPGG
jgi:signal transduction histidine kinase